MKHFFYINIFAFTFLLGNLHNAFAQLNIDSLGTRTDSISMQIDHKEFAIYDYRASDFTSGIRTINIPLSLIENNNSMSNLSDALQNIGGIYMRSYGNAMNNAVTLRGFGPERTSILWNGIALNNAGLGQLDMNLMPGGFFNSIKLIEGSSSTQYGNGAQGGSLLLEYKPDFNNRFNLHLQQEFGSFFTWNTSAQTQFGNKFIQGRTAFLRNSATNNYAYKDKTTAGFPTRETENANFFSYQIIQDLFFKLKRNWNFSLHGWHTYTDRKIPPGMGAANNHSEQYDNNTRAMIQLRKSLEKHDFHLQVAYLRDELIYHTDAFKDSSSIHSGQAQIQYTFRPKPFFTLMSGGNFSINYSAYKYYNLPATELRGNVFVMTNLYLRTSFRNRIEIVKISTGVRQQFSSHYTSYPSAHAGIDYSLKKNKHLLMLSGAINTAYRMPTLNDLYWVPGGNINLLPEYSWNLENAYKYEYKSKAFLFTMDVLGYFGRTSNWIQWIPGTSGIWTPQNITEVQSAGFETGSMFSVQKKKWHFLFQARYNFTHTTDINNNFSQLIYVPEHTLKGTIELKWQEISLTLLPSYYSKRYSLSDHSQFIPSFFLLNIQAAYKLKLKSNSIGFFVRLGNATHADYQMVLNRPMPGINFNIGINFYLNLQNKKQ